MELETTTIQLIRTVDGEEQVERAQTFRSVLNYHEYAARGSGAQAQQPDTPIEIIPSEAQLNYQNLSVSNHERCIGQLIMILYGLVIIVTPGVGFVIGIVSLSLKEDLCPADPLAPLLTIGSFLSILALIYIPIDLEEMCISKWCNCILELFQSTFLIWFFTFTTIVVRLSFRVNFEQGISSKEDFCDQTLFSFSWFKLGLMWVSLGAYVLVPLLCKGVQRRIESYAEDEIDLSFDLVEDDDDADHEEGDIDNDNATEELERQIERRGDRNFREVGIALGLDIGGMGDMGSQNTQNSNRRRY